MRQGSWRHSPALIVATIALFVALGGSVYAAKQARISGGAIRVKSLPGNRLALHSLPANRLQRGVLHGARLNTPLTGAEINELTLGQVPNATHADSADTARSATDAQTALNAVNAIDAQTVNGHSAGCMPSAVLFAGACWDGTAADKATAPLAASSCAARGGALPEALQLAAFAERPEVNLNEGDEWTSDIPLFSGLNIYGVATVSPSGEINAVVSTITRAYRCVTPLLA
jgi:hypothetical protein